MSICGTLRNLLSKHTHVRAFWGLNKKRTRDLTDRGNVPQRTARSARTATFRTYRVPPRRPRSRLSRFRGNGRTRGQDQSDAAVGQTGQWFLPGADPQVMATGTIAKLEIVCACPNFF